ncbi:MAG: hypothetical protein A2086_02320 [Spirochaetes bacterium GWD1_27_9]|nr:MAG: hypothetical protein A2086_02320 [Spirochaetes bacterium GWD1_27_9]
MKDFIEKLKALSDENRFRIVMMLKIKPLCVCEIYSVLSISNSTVSTHLKTLRNAKIIDYKKDGRWMEYFILPEIITLLDMTENLIKNKEIINNDREKLKYLSRDVCSANFEKNK